MNVVVLLGPPGAGKGTVAEVLSSKGFHHVSTGALLREQIRLQTPLGLQAKALMEQGHFVQDDVVVGMIRDLMVSAPIDACFLFDGFPRTVVQAQKLDELIASLDGSIDKVVLMECPDEVIVERLSGRRTCSRCGAVYHMVYNPPEHGSRCNLDGCGLEQRSDDAEETIRKRIEVYETQTAPLIEYYSSKNLVHAIDATQAIEKVRASVLEHLG